jgi:quercetin dioxygenase-like cupin family protein
MAVSFAAALLAGTLGAHSLSADTPSFKRVELQRHDLTAKDREAVTARAEFQPGGAAPRHSHPGEEFGYVLEGEFVLEIDGQPPKAMKPGDSFFIPAGTVHAAKNPGKTGAAVLSTYIIEKGKPLATPAK